MDDIKTKLAGKFMALQSNDLFQESLEGIGAGAMAGMGMLGTGIPIEQVALQTASAMGFGVGIGLLGKNIGARIGKALHPQALKKSRRCSCNTWKNRRAKNFSKWCCRNNALW